VFINILAFEPLHITQDATYTGDKDAF